MVKELSIGKVKVHLIDCELENNKPYFKEDLLKIVRDTNELEYPRIIEEKNSYEYLYHLSDIRGNLVRWLPIKEGEAVLEINAECGAITGELLKLSDNTTALCSCATDAEILAERYPNCNGFVIYAGELKASLEALEASFDWIILNDARLLPEAKMHLKNNGRVVFATDNRMGMRNINGMKAVGEAEYFSGVEGKTDSGFTFAGLRKVISLSGFKKAQMFYPYPDYRFMKTLFSNSRLPKVGELVDNHTNYESDRLELFSEKDAFDASCEDGSFQYYSNSYLVVLGEPVSTEYARFSNERAPEYKIFTTIENIAGARVVKKYPISERANDHIRNLAKYNNLLNEKYAGSKLCINKCGLLDIGNRVSASFEFIEGVELTKLLDDCLQRNDLESFYALFEKYYALTGFNEDYPFADLDVVFSNIIVNKDEWTLIDYEWCKESKILARETAYRALHCYVLEDENRKKFNQDFILKRIGLSKEAAEEIEKDEFAFQSNVTGKNLTLAQFREQLGFKSINPISLAGKINDDNGIYRFQVYPGGNTAEFSEETSFVIKDAYVGENFAEATVPVCIEDSVMRIDPLDSPCIVVIREAKLGEVDFPVENKKYFKVNGKRLGDNVFVFPTSDPNMYFNIDGFVHNEDTFLYLKLELIPMPSDAASAVSDNIKKLF